jgi:signal transduction histidine kinase
MATAASSSLSKLDQRKGANRQHFGLAVYLWVFNATIVVGAVVGAIRYRNFIAAHAPIILVWIALVAAADVLAVPLWGVVTLSVSLPLSLTAAFLLPPYPAGLIGLIGTTDTRDFKRSRTLAMTTYNRAQTALSIFIASAVFHMLHGSLSRWPLVVLVALAALVCDFVVNLSLVLIPTSWESGASVLGVIKGIYGKSPLEHAGGYLSLGLFGLLLALAVRDVGHWALLLALLPLAVARQMFMHRRRLDEAARRLKEKDAALAAAAVDSAEERREERIAVAGELHDEVLPPLFKVHLLGQVLRRDLESGQLLQADEDLPELLSATAVAQHAIRGVVSGLRHSELGPRGLVGALEGLIQELSVSSGPPIDLRVMQPIAGEGVYALLAFQACREAIRNAVKYSKGTQVVVSIWEELGGSLSIEIHDDGVGFDPLAVDKSAHFGLQFMQERIEAVGDPSRLPAKPIQEQRSDSKSRFSRETQRSPTQGLLREGMKFRNLDLEVGPSGEENTHQRSQGHERPLDNGSRHGPLLSANPAPKWGIRGPYYRGTPKAPTTQNLPLLLSL